MSSLKTEHQTMPCPMGDCNGQIIFNTWSMLQGAKYACPNCHAEIGISPESHDKVEETIGKFEQMRDNMAQQKQNLNS